MTVTEPKPRYKYVGTRPVRHDGLEKVTGRARFAADLNLPGQLHGVVVRSPHAHARIVYHRHVGGPGHARRQGGDHRR